MNISGKTTSVSGKKASSLVVAMLVVVFGTFLWGSRGVSAEKDIPPVDYVGKDIEQIVEGYHTAMNNLVNFKIKKFMSYSEEELLKFDVPPREKTRTVPDDDGRRREEPTSKYEPCTEENTSTVCLSQAMVREYFAFRTALENKRTSLEGEVKKQAADEEKPVKRQTLTDLASLQSQNSQFVTAELDIARKALDTTLLAYNELHTAWPMHKKYQTLIGRLEDYRDELSDLRFEIEKYPSVFLNATTASCQ
ncbi:MAG: hypothetical protein AAB592_03545 [Patescibacteria group bacterium]